MAPNVKTSVADQRERQTSQRSEDSGGHRLTLSGDEDVGDCLELSAASTSPPVQLLLGAAEPVGQAAHESPTQPEECLAAHDPAGADSEGQKGSKGADSVVCRHLRSELSAPNACFVAGLRTVPGAPDATYTTKSLYVGSWAHPALREVRRSLAELLSALPGLDGSILQYKPLTRRREGRGNIYRTAARARAKTPL